MRDAIPLFLMLYLGHTLGDFALQPGRLVIAKRNGICGALLHTGIVTAATALIVAPDLPRMWPAVLTAGLLHLGVEELTIRARKSPHSSNLTVFLLDQGLHAVSLALIALSAAPARPVLALGEVTVETLAAVTGVATVALFGSILVFEIDRDRSARAGEKAEALLRLDLPRAYGWAERGGALALALFGPWPPLGLIAFAPRLALAVLGSRGRRGSHGVAALAGSALCALVWLLVLLAS